MTTLDWRKSTRSNAQGADCVEVASVTDAKAAK
ncbi:MAG: hypothetical protein JWP48_6067 [Actinoallomurus sp.]|jgi:hypothetical protein|nr:hypothetical protein [Actinoallomurus sp.]